MRKLTQDQKEKLKNHLSQRKIRYVELYDEIYDHYASVYEFGKEELEETIHQLDAHFTQAYINQHKEQISKSIYKSLLANYKKEFASFFQWPQIVTSIVTGLLIIALAYLIPEDIYKLYILLPCFVIPFVPFAYFFIQEHRKLVPLNLKSAAFEVLNKLGIIPVLAFNAVNILLIFGDHLNKVETAILLGISVLILIVYDIITIKVFKQKIKYQMA